MRTGDEPWDLRARLNVLLVLVFLLALLVASVFLLANARRAIVDELRASSDFAALLVAGIGESVLHGAQDTTPPTLIDHLAAHAPLRHLRITLRDARGHTVQTNPPAGEAWPAPAWFRELVRPRAASLERELDIGGARLTIVADPEAEIGEAWRDVRTSLLVLGLAFASATLGTSLFLGRALRPLRQLSRGLEGVERGQFTVRLAPSGLPDLDRITARFNDMARTLEQSERDNAELARRSLAIQEDERRRLAHELHDDLGQSITAIKALAVAIRQRADGVVAERAATIMEVSSDIYDRVRRMMSRLRPVALDELGLVPALETMIDDWNEHHEDCFCEFTAPRDLPALDPDLGIAAYRTVQEALTNIARHAAARNARVSLARGRSTQGESTLELIIADNGRGFAPARTRLGLGLRGIRERVLAGGGSLNLVAAPGAGVRLEAVFPLAVADAA